MRILRIDERLIHGQVMIGWIENAGFSNIILLHESIDAFVLDTYQNMLRDFNFRHINISRHEQLIFHESKILFIMKDLSLMSDNFDILNQLKIDLLNLGGIRKSNPVMTISPSVQLNQNDVDILEIIKNKFALEINAQELPYSNSITLFNGNRNQ